MALIMAGSGETLTYAQLDAEANRVSRVFREAGLVPGDHVAWCLENHRNFLPLVWGAYYAGLVSTPISSRLTADEIAYTLMGHPDQLARLRADRSLVPSAVDEVLRFEPPVQIDGRLVRDGTEIGGHAIPRGHRVLLMLGAANRDPAAVDDPDRFDVGRSEVPMLSFAYGIHYCLGAALARVEGQVVLEALLDRFGTWTPLDDDPRWIPRIGLRGLASLPVAFS